MHRHPLSSRLPLISPPAGTSVDRQPAGRCTERERLAWLTSRLSGPGPVVVWQRLPDGGTIRSARLARLEAALLIAEGSTSAARLAQVAQLIDAAEVVSLVEVLNDSYDRTRGAFRVEESAAGFVLMTRASLSGWLDRLHNRPARMKLSPPMQETLTIIAYQQPVTRADVEAVRGVQSSEMIRQLLDRELIRIAGTDESLGRPFLYETTRHFLSLFGLKQIEDLPNYATLRRIRPAPPRSPESRPVDGPAGHTPPGTPSSNAA
jgi:segregation and condensation protein B